MGYRPTDLVPFGKGFALPKRFSEPFETKELPYRLEIEVVLEGDRFICQSLRAERKKGGDPVTSQGLRKLPIQDLIRGASLGVLHRVKRNPEGNAWVLQPLNRVSFRRFAKKGPTMEALEHVALVYRLAYAANESPTKAVQEAFGLARSTAERWVSKARDAGLIEIDDPRRKR
jgi:hypothetical protein